ncbi:hypothetical protein NDN01_06565 [Sphingomonas sp. QA11]|uniref:hypothetical protein n=1 Tax=Sphingomonas sp. QA11 TaxID=2950605 RepID=UPI002349EDBA|nr:hypothetical protein [Sphingomonas sp. QA11]WCM28580.1 hypothetical protein NDN01_06565 [Sphingomonas sp. QA11]
MRQPGNDDLTVLRGVPAEWFQQWLGLGLREYLFERRGRYAFPGAEPFIEQGEGNIASDLVIIAGALGVRDRHSFGQGLIALLASLDFGTDFGAIIAAYLIELGVGVRAAGMPRIIANKAFSIQPTESGRKLYELAFTVAGQLADLEAEDTVICLRHLINQPRLFRSSLSGRALLALCKARPRAFPDHFDLLRKPLEEKLGRKSRVAAEEQRRVRQRRRLIATLVEIMPEPNLLAYPCAPNARREREEDNWWLMALSEDFPDLLKEFVIIADAEAAIQAEEAPAEDLPVLAVGATRQEMWYFAMDLLGPYAEEEYLESEDAFAI